MPEIESDLATHYAKQSEPDHVAPVLEAELRDALADEGVAERIASQRSWLAVQSAEAERCRSNIEQIRFLVGEASNEIARLTATGDELNEQVVAASAAVNVALAAGDVTAATRNQERVNTVGQTLARLPAMIATAEANRVAAEAQLPAAEEELVKAEVYVRNARNEIARLEGLPSGTAWDEPNPAPERQVPDLLGLAQRMVVNQERAALEEMLEGPLVLLDGERRPRPSSPRAENDAIPATVAKIADALERPKAPKPKASKPVGGWLGPTIDSKRQRRRASK